MVTSRLPWWPLGYHGDLYGLLGYVMGKGGVCVCVWGGGGGGQ